MSEIEKTCRLSLALDRVYRHGHLYLNEDIDTPPLRKALANLNKAISQIPDWDKFIENEAEWWVGFENERAENET